MVIPGPHNEQTHIYRQIADEIRQRVIAGDWRVGAQIPSRRDLARQYGVALATIERAIALLLRDGVLRAERGRRGTVVADRTLAPAFSEAPPLPVHLAASAQLGKPSTSPITAGAIYRALNYALPDPMQAYYASWESMMMHSFERAFSSLGGHHQSIDLEMYPADTSYQQAVHTSIDSLIASGVKVLLACGVYAGEVNQKRMIECLRSVTVPYLFISNIPLEAPIPHLTYDERYSGYLAAQHLLSQGYRQIIYFAPFFAEWSTNRYAGACQAIADAHMPPDTVRRYPDVPVCAWFYDDNTTRDVDVSLMCARRMLADEVLRSSPGTPGIIAQNDTTALYCLQVLQAAGLRMGEEFGLVGFDDCPGARAAGLTSIRPPFETLGTTAAYILMQAAQGLPIAMQTRLAPDIIQRPSTVQALSTNEQLSSYQTAAVHQLMPIPEAS